LPVVAALIALVALGCDKNATLKCNKCEQSNSDAENTAAPDPEPPPPAKSEEHTFTPPPTTAEPRRAVGGPCQYHEITGTARIVDIRTPEPGQYSCRQDPVQVIFEFTPDDPGAAGRYRQPGVPDAGRRLTLVGGANPPRAWVRIENLSVGSTHRCVRMELTEGACTPVMFLFPEIDYAAASRLCW
jgi:hypothetical protein